MKSLPQSVYSTCGTPQICHRESSLRQIAWRRASAVLSAEGASKVGEVSCQGSAVVVQDHGEPGLGGRLALTDHQDI